MSTRFLVSIVGGALGAGLGAAIGGPGGAAKGASIGWALGSYALDAIFYPPEKAPGPDTTARYTSAIEGFPWAKVWGKAAVSSNVIWLYKDANGNHLIDASTIPRNWVMGQLLEPPKEGVVTTFACGFCCGEIFVSDPSDPLGGEFINRNVKIDKIFFNDEEVYNRETNYNKYGLNLWSGLESQSVDPVLASHLGSDASAHKGLLGFSVSSLPVGTFFNQIPGQIKAFVSTDTLDLATIVQDVLKIAGIPSSRIDVTDLVGVAPAMAGFAWRNNETPRQILDQIIMIEDLLLVESDGKIRLIRRSSVQVFDIDESWLGMVPEGQEPVRLKRKMRRVDQLPAKMTLAYIDPAQNFQRATSIDHYSNPASIEHAVLETPFSLSRAVGDRVVKRELERTYLQNSEFEFSLHLGSLKYTPADALRIPMSDGRIREILINGQSINPAGPIGFTGVIHDSEVSNQTVAPPPSESTDNPKPMVPSSFIAFSKREIIAAHQSAPGFYVGATGENGWNGGTVFFRQQGTNDWTQGSFLSLRATWGVSTGVLGNPVLTSGRDVTNSVGVNLSESKGELQTVSDSQVDGTENWAWLGNEILGFSTATLTAANRYTLSRFLRERNQTVGTDHQNGEDFILANTALSRIPVPEAHVGSTYEVRVVSPGQAITDVVSKTVVIAPRTKLQQEDDIDDLKTGMNNAYIKNQNATAQSANMRIAGNGYIQELNSPKINISPNFGWSGKAFIGFQSSSVQNGTSNFIRWFDDGSDQQSESNNSYGIGFSSNTGRIAYTAGNGGVHQFFVENTSGLLLHPSYSWMSRSLMIGNNALPSGRLHVQGLGNFDDTFAFVAEQASGAVIARIRNNGTFEALQSVVAGSSVSAGAGFRNQGSTGVPFENILTGAGGWNWQIGHTTDRVMLQDNTNIRKFMSMWKSGRVTYGNSDIDDGANAHQLRGSVKCFDGLDVAGDFRLNGSTVRLLTDLVTVTSDGTSAITLDASLSHSFRILSHQNSDGTVPAGTNFFVSLEAPTNGYNGQIITIICESFTPQLAAGSQFHYRFRFSGTTLTFRMAGSSGSGFYQVPQAGPTNVRSAVWSTYSFMFVSSLNRWVQVSAFGSIIG
jgi:hypothetical protein